VDYLIKQAREKASKIDSMLLDQAKLKLQLEDSEKAKGKIKEGIADLNARIESLEAENGLLRSGASSKESGYLAEVDRANAQVRELQHLLREEKMSTERLQVTHAEKQRAVQSISSETIRLREKHTESLARLTLQHEAEVAGLRAELDARDAQLAGQRAQLEGVESEQTRLAEEREEEKDTSAKLRASLKTQEALTVKKENELAKLTAEVNNYNYNYKH
jgi:chromosome segregation ATPase